MRPGAAALCAALGVAVATHASAQSSATPGSLQAEAPWLFRWSPLDVPTTARSLPTGARPYWIASTPSARSVLAAGDPAAFASALPGRWTDFRGGIGRTSGDFRRPLEPARHTGFDVAGLSWHPAGSGALIGRVELQQTSSDPDSYANAFTPYNGSPFALADTSASPMRRGRVRLEGAGGWPIAGFEVGAAIGYEAHSARTDAAQLPRTGRWARSAATLGVARPFSGGRARIALFATAGGDSERAVVHPATETGLVMLVRGYRDPGLEPVIATAYSLRVRRQDRRIGGTINSAAGALDVTGGAWTGTHEERRWRVALDNDPPTDVWTTDALGAFAALRLQSRTSAFTGELAWERLEGEGERVDSAGLFFTARESAWTGRLTSDWTPGVWQVGAAVDAVLRSSRRDDLTVLLHTDLAALDASFALFVRRAIASRARLSFGAAYGTYDARGMIPNPFTRVEHYRRVVAPAISLSGTPANSYVLSGGLDWKLGTDRNAFLRVSHQSMSPLSSAVIPLPLAPTGGRSATGLSAGLSWGMH